MKKEIPIKNYIILGVIVLAAILLTLFAVKWIKDYNSQKMSVSPLEGKIQSVKLEEIDTVISEINEAVIYIGYTGDKRLYITEERLLNYLNKHDFSNKFIYINVSDKLKNDEYIDIIKEKLNITNDLNIEAPSLIYMKNNEVIRVVSNQTGYLYTNDISKLNIEFSLEDK